MILTTQDQASAQVLPYQPRVSVFGNLNAAVPSRVFEILGDPRTHDLGIELSQTSGTGAPIEMAVYDASGRKIADSEPGSGPDPRVLSMNVPTDQLSQSSGVFVKIAAAAGSPGFLVVFLRHGLGQLRPAGHAGAGSELAVVLAGTFLTPPVHLGDGSSSLATGISPSAFERGSESSPTVPADSAQAEVALGASLVVSSASPGQQPLSSPVVATGPLPERAGAPLGGVLAEGDPVPQIDRHDPALIDLALIGLPEPEPLPGLAGRTWRRCWLSSSRLRRRPRGWSRSAVPVGLRSWPLRCTASRRRTSDALIAVLPPAAATATVARPEPAGAVIPVETVAEAAAEADPYRLDAVGRDGRDGDGLQPDSPRCEQADDDRRGTAVPVPVPVPSPRRCVSATLRIDACGSRLERRSRRSCGPRASVGVADRARRARAITRGSCSGRAGRQRR